MRFFRRADPLAQYTAVLRAMRNETVHARWEQNADRLYDLLCELDHQKRKKTRLERSAFRLMMVPVLAASHADRPAARIHGGVIDWFATVAYLLPRQIREPWLGDLREDRMEMARNGAPRWWIEVCTAGQILVLGIQVLRTRILELADTVRRFG